MRCTCRTIALVAMVLAPLSASAAQRIPSLSLTVGGGISSATPYSTFSTVNGDQFTTFRSIIDQTPLWDAQLTFAPPSWKWRFVADYAWGHSTLLTDFRSQWSAGNWAVEWMHEPASTGQLSAGMQRTVSSHGASVDLSGGWLRQRISTRVLRWRSNITMGGMTPYDQAKEYVDQGAYVGGAVGPTTGWLRGLRLGARLTALSTSDRMYRDARESFFDLPIGYYPVPKRGDRTTQQGVVFSLGWMQHF